MKLPKFKTFKFKTKKQKKQEDLLRQYNEGNILKIEKSIGENNGTA